jgi:hypothetical protein
MRRQYHGEEASLLVAYDQPDCAMTAPDFAASDAADECSALQALDHPQHAGLIAKAKLAHYLRIAWSTALSSDTFADHGEHLDAAIAQFARCSSQSSHVDPTSPDQSHFSPNSLRILLASSAEQTSGGASRGASVGTALFLRHSICCFVAAMIAGTIFDGWSQDSRAAWHPAVRTSGGRCLSVFHATASQSRLASSVIPTGAVRVRQAVSSLRNVILASVSEHLEGGACRGAETIGGLISSKAVGSSVIFVSRIID